MKYIEEARKYYEISAKEIAEASKNGKIELGVDGCEKGWLALNLALKEMFVRKGVKEEDLPQTNRGKTYFIKKYGTKKLRRIFNMANAELHVSGFWDRNPDYEYIPEILEDINGYIKEIEKQV